MQKEKQDQFNPENERVKYKYRIHIKRALKKDEKTIFETLKHIRDYEIFDDFSSFKTFNNAIANKYIDHLFNKQLSLSYINDNIRYLKEFLRWLERQKGYRSKINYNDIDYLNISNNQKRTAKATEYKKAYTYNQILKTIRQMPNATQIQKRNKAIISLNALCGLRISELRTVKIKNLIQEEGKYFIYVNPKDMQVKFAKSRNANFMPLPQDIIDNVINWKNYLLKQGFKEKDPLFPIIPNNFNQYNLLESNIKPQEIKSNTTMLNIFKKAFTTAGFEYINPHNFRHTIVRFAEKRTPEFLNAVRQSLGHKSINTTLQSYGELSEYEQRNRISGFEYDFDKEK